MKCLKCGAYVYSSDKFCRSCGATLNSETCQYGDNISNSKYDSSSCHEQQYKYSYEYSNQTKPTYNMAATHQEQFNYSATYSYDQSKYDYAYSPNDSGDDKYIKAYIGNNYALIKKMKFSFPALIFGPWYLLYRKVWGYAIGAIIISIAASILLSNDFADFINLIINIYFACKFKEIYMKQAEDQVESIKQQNLDKSTNELLDVCRKKGGVSFKYIGVIITIGIFAIVALGVYLGMKYDSTTPLPQLDDNYDNQILKGKVGELTYTIPTGYKETYSTDNYQKFENSNCSITIEKRIPYGFYSDADSYLNSLTATSSGINAINYNGHEWKYKQFNQNSYYNTVYAYKYNDTLYLLTLANINYHSCNTQYNQILPTLKFN